MVDGVVNSDKEKYSWNIKKFIEKTPCARESFLYGIVGGAVVGAGYFLKSMHVIKSCRYAVGSFALISFGGWELCRYMKYKEKEAIKESVDKLNQYKHQKRDRE
ncbi:cytochrome c oxidase assembly protein COX20, mitochondrial-like [Acropora palmata]